METILSKNYSLKLVVFILLCFLAVWFFPKFDQAFHPLQEGPGTITVFGVGIVISLLTAALLFFGLKSSASLPKKFLLFAILYNILIVIVKFTISPLAVYQYNQTKPFSVPINENPLIIGTMALVVFLLYFIVFFSIYVYYKRKVNKTISPVQAPPPAEQPNKPKFFNIWAKLLLFGVIMLTGAGYIFVFPIFFTLFSLDYVFAIFATSYGIVIALVLLAATYFVSQVFNSTAKQALMLRDISILASFFWVGLGFLIIYHALWVVYLLILTSIWPLRVVVPK